MTRDFILFFWKVLWWQWAEQSLSDMGREPLPSFLRWKGVGFLSPWGDSGRGGQSVEGV